MQKLQKSKRGGTRQGSGVVGKIAPNVLQIPEGGDYEAQNLI